MFGNNSFMQKVVICAVIGAALAAVNVFFYRNIVQAGDNALNKGYRERTQFAPNEPVAPPPRQVVPAR